MLFLWTTTDLGKIWLDGEGFRQIIAKRLPQGYYCQEVSFLGEQNLLNIYITLPDSDAESKKLALEEKFKALFAECGILAEISWLYIAPQDNPKAMPAWRLPIFWAGATALFVSVIRMGFKGVLWAIVAAVLGYGVSWLVLTEDGNKFVDKIVEQFRRR
ncbi:hypothetical protein LJC40_06025 [Synergistaceae bacterium OttesenSCG-928-D05]|nr:hypothetical protein [Synergistaceae bacterium OttesenSCG-928-D05]